MQNRETQELVVQCYLTGICTLDFLYWHEALQPVSVVITGSHGVLQSSYVVF